MSESKYVIVSKNARDEFMIFGDIVFGFIISPQAEKACPHSCKFCHILRNLSCLFLFKLANWGRPVCLEAAAVPSLVVQTVRRQCCIVQFFCVSYGRSYATEPNLKMESTLNCHKTR